MKLLIAILLAISATHVMALPSSREILELHKSAIAHHKDLIELAKFSRGPDQDRTGRLMKLSQELLGTVNNVTDMIHILSLVTNDADKKAILSYIKEKLSLTVRELDFHIKEVNLEASNVQGTALVSAADKLKTDIRTLQTMIASP